MADLSPALHHFRIEPLTVAELPAVQALEAAAGLTAWGEEAWQDDLCLPRTIALVVRSADHDEVLGFLLAWVIDDEFQLHNMAVKTEARGQGIGATLLLAALRQAVSMGARCGFLEVRASNQAAQRLYSRHGFSVISVRRSYYRQPVEDALLMSCLDPGSIVTSES